MDLARTLFANKQLSIPDICSRLGVSRSTLYRYLGGETKQPEAEAAPV